MAFAVAAYYTLVTPIYTYMIFRNDGMSVAGLATLYLVPTVLGAAAAAMGVAAANLVRTGSDIGQIAVITSTSCMAYVLLLRMIDPQGFAEVETLVRRIIRRPH